MFWPNIKIYCTKYDNEVNTEYPDEIYVAVIHLGFRLGWNTLYNKLGPKLSKTIIYMMKQNLLCNNSKKEETLAKATANLTVCLRNEIPSIDFVNEIEKENSYKRKLASDNDSHEPVAKCSRW